MGRLKQRQAEFNRQIYRWERLKNRLSSFASAFLSIFGALVQKCEKHQAVLVITTPTIRVPSGDWRIPCHPGPTVSFILIWADPSLLPEHFEAK